MIRVLRLSTEPGHVSAQVFADAFAAGLWPDVLVEDVPAAAWLASTLGGAPLLDTEAAAARRFAAATADYDFFCPDYRTTALVPWLVHLRNVSGSALRLLLIAHAPGALGLEFALLTPLLREGDRIVAPTASARDVIGLLSPPLLAHTCVLPHPLAPLPAAAQPARAELPRFVSLTRIHSSKLLHRQIEAVRLLKDRGVPVLLEIAGPLNAAEDGRPLQYGRALAAQVERLGLQEQVSLVGAVRGARDKAGFLCGAAALLNLSVSVEESLGKAVVESLGCGVPVITTAWDGLPETAGSGGVRVPVHADGIGVNVSAAEVADAIEEILLSPPSARTCIEESRRFQPAVVRESYRQMLERARSGQPAESSVQAGGLLAVTAPLTALTAGELFDLHVRDWPRQLALLDGAPAGTPSAAERLRGLVLTGTWRPLERLLAGLDPAEHAVAVGQARPSSPSGELLGAITSAATAAATIGSRLACAAELADAGRADELEQVLIALRRDGMPPERGAYLQVELLRLRAAPAEQILSAALAMLDPERESEAGRLVQLGTVAREAGRPAEALPALRTWLAKFPDSLAAADVWVQRAACAVDCEPPIWDEAALSAGHARLLRGPEDAAPVLPSAVVARIEQQHGRISSVSVLSPPSTTLLVQAGDSRFVAQRLSSRQRPEVVSDVLTELATRTPPLCPPVIAVVADSAEVWLVSGYLADAAGRPDWPTMLSLLVMLRETPAAALCRLEPAWLRRLAVLSDDEDVAALLVALSAAVPSGGPTLAHGDLQPSNVLAAADCPVLVDWEELGAAAPGFDAGWLLALASVGGIAWSRKEIWDDLVAAGFDESDLYWFEGLGLLRLLFRARTIRLEAQVRDLVVAQIRRSVLDVGKSDHGLRRQSTA